MKLTRKIKEIQKNLFQIELKGLINKNHKLSERIDWTNFSAFRFVMYAVFFLIIFGVDPVRGMSPAVDRDRDEVHRMNPWHRDHQEEPINVLSIDGGGVRGIIPAVFLRKLEERMERPICEIFDLVAGTSTGAILSLGLTTTLSDNSIRSAEDMIQLYKTLSKWIFPPSDMPKGLRNIVDLLSKSKYNPAPFEQALLDHFHDKRLSDIVIPSVITSMDISTNKLTLFRNYRAGWEPKENHLIRDVAQASGSPPTYFPMKTIKPLSAADPALKLVDGGMSANNPSNIALAEARRLFGSTRRINLISLGTGHNAELPKPEEKVALFMARPIIDMLFSGNSDATHKVLHALSEGDERSPLKYYRINVPLGEDLMSLDDSTHINDLHIKANEHFQNDFQFEFIIDSLTDALNVREN